MSLIVQSDETQQLMQALPVAVLVCDLKGKILQANMLAQSQIGISQKQLQGRDLRWFFSPEEEINRLFNVVFHAETVVSDMIVSRFNQQPFSLHLKDNGPDEVVVVLIPEANRVEAEEQVRRQEMADAVARIALERAHEVKNPLTSLRGAAQLLVESCEGEQKEIADHVLREVDRIRERIDTFLQIAPRANVQMEPVNIHQLIDRVCMPPKGIQYKRMYDPGLPEILMHASRFEQAIENLWINALEAGSQTIQWRTCIAPMVRLPTHRGMVLEIRITSDGKPIPEHLLHQLFEPYVTGKSRGSGLGLAIVQQVVREHEGRIRLESHDGKTSFVIHVPLKVAGSKP